MTYATPEEVRLAEDLGYTWDVNQERGHVFYHGRRRVWACAADNKPRVGNQEGPLMAWQTADIIDHRPHNHQKFDSLAEALERPL